MVIFFNRAPEIDISELESLFSAASASDGGASKSGGRRGANINKPEKVQLVSFFSAKLILFVTVKICLHIIL